MALFELPANKLTMPKISGSMLMTPLTNVDSNTSFTLNFDQGDIRAQAILSCSINAKRLTPGVSIRFEKGIINIQSPIYCPKEFTVEYFNQSGASVREEKRVFEYVGGKSFLTVVTCAILTRTEGGWHFQADEVARCVRDGKLESDLWGHNKSLLEMHVFDEVGCLEFFRVRIEAEGV